MYRESEKLPFVSGKQYLFKILNAENNVKSSTPMSVTLAGFTSYLKKEKKSVKQTSEVTQ